MVDPAVLRVFISYRRDDTAGYAGRLYDSLIARLDVADVFMDVGDIEPGIDFTAAIQDAVDTCDVMLALIGSRWVTAMTPEGRRRLEDPDDYVAAEIGAALERDVRLIPVLIEDTPMPAADALPERLRGLAHRNAIEMSTVSWPTDFEALVAALHRLTPRSRPPSQLTVESLPTNLEATADASTTAGRPASPSDRQPLFRRRGLWAAVAGAAIASVLVIAAIALIGGDNSNDQRDEYPFQHSPESGLPGTTVELSGRCTPPEGWRFPGAAFGMDDAEGTKVLDDFVELQDGSWEGQLRIPDGTSAGPYYIWATCYGTPTGAKARNFHDYETTEFSVTNP